MAESCFAAVDLGAESGRVMVGRLANGRIGLTEAHRFPNIPVYAHGTLHWDILRLWHEVQAGLAKVAADTRPAGIGVDTWGVDFALLTPDGTLLGNPVAYRDARTTGVPERLFTRLAKPRLYQATGIQTLVFNTIFQLASMTFASSPLLQQAGHLLFIPDLLCYWLTGRLATEYTIASTSQMLDARARTWWQEALFAVGAPRVLFPEMITPATAQSRWGQVPAAVGDALGVTDVPVLAVGSHDTASAVAAVPAEGDDWLYLSSGTWSLLGAEVDQPVLSQKAFGYNLTNEGGVGGKIRLLKNIAGMWLVQECRREWARQGKEYDYATLTRMAAAAPSQTAIIEPDDAAFATAGDMPAKIAEHCRQTGQPAPQDHATTVRVCLESLAVRYAKVVAMLEDATTKKYKKLHIVGGGSQNDLLNQWAADATGLTVYAGPVEATALGNVLSQAITTGQIGSLAEGRRLIAQSVAPKVFTPRNTERWQRYLRP